MRIAAIGYQPLALDILHNKDVIISYFDVADAIADLNEFDCFFLYSPTYLTTSLIETGKIILINSVVVSLQEIGANQKMFRVNHWPGFIKKQKWEIAGTHCHALDELFYSINKEYMIVKDEPGLIAPRILAMIINEAYYTMADKVSSSAEIDIAMQLGTGYPQGPVAWGEEIGLRNIYDLLLHLSEENDRYLPCPLLKKIALKN